MRNIHTEIKSQGGGAEGFLSLGIAGSSSFTELSVLQSPDQTESQGWSDSFRDFLNY